MRWSQLTYRELLKLLLTGVSSSFGNAYLTTQISLILIASDHTFIQTYLEYPSQAVWKASLTAFARFFDSAYFPPPLSSPAGRAVACATSPAAIKKNSERMFERGRVEAVQRQRQQWDQSAVQEDVWLSEYKTAQRNNKTQPVPVGVCRLRSGQSELKSSEARRKVSTAANRAGGRCVD